MRQDYVHGYEASETARLRDQASTLEDLLHHDTAYPAGSTVLEAGCGVGAQTVPLVSRSPGAAITCIDISAASLAEAATQVAAAGLKLPRFQQADLHALPFPDACFDHVFVCFVLEHLARPIAALTELRRVLKPGGALTVIEGDHGSTFFHPENEAARMAVQCQVALQQAAGGDALIGRCLYPLLVAAGFQEVAVSPRMVYVDSSRPDWVDGFIRKTFTTMVANVREAALAGGLATADQFDEGIRGLLRTAEPDGVFCYTFFKAVGRNAEPAPPLVSGALQEVADHHADGAK